MTAFSGCVPVCLLPRLQRILENWNCCVIPAFGEAHQWAQAHFFVAQESARCATPQVIGCMALELDRVREIAERVAASSGLEVVEVEVRGGGKARMLRIVIDKLAGVTHED